MVEDESKEMFINTLSFLNSDSVEVTIMDADKTRTVILAILVMIRERRSRECDRFS